MAVTRLQRKELLNKTRARVRVENLKINKSRIYIKSPYAAESGIILGESDIELTTSVEPATEAVTAKKEKKVKAVTAVETPVEDVVSNEPVSESETSIPEETPIERPDESGQDIPDSE
jgi:hypothetical protein